MSDESDLNCFKGHIVLLLFCRDWRHLHVRTTVSSCNISVHDLEIYRFD